jgi:hypothetical protein
MVPVDRYSLAQVLEDLAGKNSTTFSAVLIRHSCTLAECDAFVPFSVEALTGALLFVFPFACYNRAHNAATQMA